MVTDAPINAWGALYTSIEMEKRLMLTEVFVIEKHADPVSRKPETLNFNLTARMPGVVPRGRPARIRAAVRAGVRTHLRKTVSMLTIRFT